jgi:hypothetical protein
MLKRQRKEKKVRRQERNREEVARIRRGEVTALKVFEERMRRRVVGEEKKVERRLRKKEAWLQRRKEAKAVAMTTKREAANANKEIKAREKGSEVEVADGTLFGRVAALEKRLEEQERGEKRRVEEAYSEGREEQARKTIHIFDKLNQRSKEKERKLMWELKEERRKSQRLRREQQGIIVKDRLAARNKPTPPIRARPQWRNWDQRWEAANNKGAVTSPEDPDAMTPKQVQGGKRNNSYNRKDGKRRNNSYNRNNSNGRSCSANTYAPFRCIEGKSVAQGDAALVGAKPKYHRERSGRSGTSSQTDYRLQVPGTEVVKDNINIVYLLISLLVGVLGTDCFSTCS